jgi:hypothetical protein
MTQSEQYWTSVQSPERLARVQFLELPVKGLMHPILIIAVLVITAVPLGFFSLRTHQVTKADAQKVVEIISGDKAKTQSYCDMTELDEQIKQAKEKKDSKTVNELSQKLDLLEERLGPEYVALMDGLEDIDPESDVAQQIESILDDLYDNLCGG